MESMTQLPVQSHGDMDVFWAMQVLKTQDARAMRAPCGRGSLEKQGFNTYTWSRSDQDKVRVGALKQALASIETGMQRIARGMVESRNSLEALAWILSDETDETQGICYLTCCEAAHVNARVLRQGVRRAIKSAVRRATGRAQKRVMARHLARSLCKKNSGKGFSDPSICRMHAYGMQHEKVDVIHRGSSLTDIVELDGEVLLEGIFRPY